LSDRYQRVLIKNKYSKNYFSNWEKVKQGDPQGSILGPFFFYINNLRGIINDISKQTIFANDTNIIFTHSNLTDFKDEINPLNAELNPICYLLALLGAHHFLQVSRIRVNIVIEKINKWFQASLLILNFNKTNYLQFMAKPKLAVDIHISYKANLINNTYSTNFLGLTLDSTLSWKTHIDQLSSKLNSACYVIRSLRSVIPTKNFFYLFIYFISNRSTMYSIS